ncbi:MAG: SurA N-terminal domain-containing protein [Gammaproteobacteria bacterium]|nr:SurA N-terminal domain-containing protein [Gammaproteobacteria bacterium]
MLQLIRDRAQGVFAWIIVGLIIIPFALWGLNEYVGGGGAPPVATVNGDDISANALENGYYRQRQQLQQMFGDKLPPNLFSEERLKAQVLEQLIDDQLVQQESEAKRMRIGNEQLWRMISSYDVFQEEGHFSRAAYERTLSMQGMQPGMFEGQLRRDLLLQQYRDSIRQSSFTTAYEVEQQLSLQNQSRDMGYVRIALSGFQDQMTVSDEEIAAEYAAHPDRYQRPEQVSLRYVELKLGDLAAGVEVSESDLKNRYEAQKINYRTPEERQASHILIEVGEDADEEAVIAAEAAIGAAQKRIEEGEPFAEVAKSVSQDPGSAPAGGDLGFFGRGVMDSAFEDAVFALQPGEMSAPVRSSFGFHLIQLIAARGGETKSFDEVKAALRKELQSEIAERELDDRAEILANLTFENPDTLQPAAEDLGLTLKETPLFSRSGGEGVSADPKVIEAAFSEDLLHRGNNSALLELSRGHFLVARLLQHQPSGLRALEEVADEVRQAVVESKSRTLASELADRLLTAIEDGKEASEVAAAHELSWQEQQGVGRNATGLDRELVSELFRISAPDEGGSQLKKVLLKNGDVAIIELRAVHSGSTGSEEERAEMRRALQRGNGSASLNAVLTTQREQSKIRRRE